MPTRLPQSVARHEVLSPKQRDFLEALEVPGSLLQKWGEFMAGLLGSLVDGYHAGTETPDWQARAKELYELATRQYFTPQERSKGRDFITLCITRYKPVLVLDLLIRCDELSRQRHREVAEARIQAYQAQLSLNDKAA